MQERHLAVRAERFLGARQLEEIDAVERPAMALGHDAQLLGGLGQRDVEAALAPRDTLAEELERERGLACARHALDEVQPVWDEAAAEDIVQPDDAGPAAR